MSYWEDRQSETLESILKKADISSDEISRLYGKSSSYLNEKIQGIFDRYRSKYNLSIQEAKQLLNSLDDSTSYDEMMKSLKNSRGEEKEQLLKKLEAPAYRYRINRLQETQQSIDDIMRNVYMQENEISTYHYIDTAQESYYRTIYNIEQDLGYELNFSNISSEHVDKLIKSKWSGKNYSQRIWNNTQSLAKELKENLLMGVLTGMTEKEMADNLTERFQVGSFKARRLIATESAYISTMMDIEAFKEADVEIMRFVAIHDLKTSEICQQHDGKYIRVDKAIAGSNVPPLHPNCRSFMIPVIDEEFDRNLKRRVRKADGTYEIVDANETYEQWYERTQGRKTEKNILKNKDDEWLPFTFKSGAIAKISNTDEVVNKMMKDINMHISSKDLLTRIEKEFRIIPEQMLQVLADNKIKIIQSAETAYDGYSKIISINESQYRLGALAHELGHVLVDINSLYENDELKEIMINVLKTSEIKSMKYSGESYITLKSDLFIRPYQGRTYITTEDFKNKKIKLQYTCLEEYISVGYETFVTNPQLLYNKDRKLYDFFVNGGIYNE